MPFGADRLAGLLTAVDRGWREGPLCVGFSGGIDSTALLHAAAELAKGAGFRLRAMHVDHGLQAASASWAEACRRTCRHLGVEFDVRIAHVERVAGASLEASARAARYAAVAAALAEGERFVVAHHRDDQLETVLIQLLRGAGVAGLAAMPGRARLGRGWLLRPLLEIGRGELAEYVERLGLSWIEDPMNGETRSDRGYLRARVLPAIEERWPAAAATIGRSASHFAEATRLLAELAAADAATLLDEGLLALDGLARLSRDRQANVLRGWLREQGLRPPPAARLAAGLRGFMAARPDGSPSLRWEGGEIRRYRGRLYALPPLPAPAGERNRIASMDLGAGLGRFSLVASRDGGLRVPPGADTVIAFRAGGEMLKPHPARPRKRLKDLCQEAGVVPWMRDRLPLVYVGGRLAAVADLWIDAEFTALAGTAALRPVWEERPRLF